MNLTVKGNSIEVTFVANEPSQYGFLVTGDDGKEYNVIPSDQFK